MRRLAQIACILALVTPAFAQTANLRARLPAYNYLPSLAALQDQVADLLISNDNPGVAALATELAETDGQAVAEFAALEARLIEKYPSDEASIDKAIKDGTLEDKLKAMEADPDYLFRKSIGPCQQASLMLRALVEGVASGKLKPVARDGIVMIDDSNADILFAKNMYQCTAMRPAAPPRPVPRIGTICQFTGDPCLNDPDEAQQ